MKSGVPDVEQISPQQLASRKTLLLLRVINPTKLQIAFTSLSTGLLAVLASLKMSFARACTLGASLSQILASQVNQRLLPTLQVSIPAEFLKWLPLTVDASCTFVAVLIAFSLNTVVSGFHSSMKGGEMAGRGVVNWMVRSGKLENGGPDPEKLAQSVGYALGGTGFVFQLWNGFGLPFPFGLLLLPLTMAEWGLAVAVTWF